MHQPGEASVEEILDSIKKVIARDTRLADDRRASVFADDPADPADEEEAEEVLQLAEDEILTPTDSRDDAFDLDHETSLIDTDIDALSDGDAFDDELGIWHDREDSTLADDGDPLTYDHDEALTSAGVRHSMQDNFAALAMLSEPAGSRTALKTGETSLEGLTRELLRPMLSRWLDDNLPQMVERMVKAEIARIAGKRD